MMKILVVEDDDRLRAAIVDVLEEELYQVDQAGTGDEGLLFASRGIYDVLILDIMLPGMDGLSLIKVLRQQSISTPALFLTAKDSVAARVQGLNAGADDYLVKPFAIEELLARIHALVRRMGSAQPSGELKYGPISLPTHTYDGCVHEHLLKLTLKEHELLTYLVRNKEQILTRSQILDRVWGIDSDAGETMVELYIHYLRKKLSPYGLDHWIRTIRGVGYMLKEDQ